MIEPEKLLDHAASLIKKPKRGRHKEVEIRRSISASYYALFHSILQASADFTIGKTHRKSAAYSIVYRSLDHTKLKRVCDEVRRTALSAKYRKALKIANFAGDIQQVAFAVLKLQEWRYDAEYNPASSFSFVDALFTHSTAHEAIEALERASEEQKRLFIAILLFDIRS
jgi:hypothetical protein